MDNTKRFDGLADVYTKARPGYAKELIDCFYNDHGMSKDSVVADIGSGTGKFAKFLIDRGSEVFCVEPNDDMRSVAEKELGSYPNFHSVNGGAEVTSLEDGSVDFITTAQAFHWFNVDKFKAECSRVLRTGGKAFLIWNMRDMDAPLNQELYKLYKDYCTAFNGFGGGIEKDDPRIIKFFDGKFEYVSFDNQLVFDKERFIEKSLSGSYSLKSGDANYDSYINALNGLFDKYSCDGIVTIPNNSVAYIGMV